MLTVWPELQCTIFKNFVSRISNSMVNPKSATDWNPQKWLHGKAFNNCRAASITIHISHAITLNQNWYLLLYVMLFWFMWCSLIRLLSSIVQPFCSSTWSCLIACCAALFTLACASLTYGFFCALPNTTVYWLWEFNASSETGACGGTGDSLFSLSMATSGGELCTDY